MDYEIPAIEMRRPSPFPFTRVSKRKRSAFYTQLARMLDAGIGVVRALATLGGQRSSWRLSRAARAMSAHVQSGGTLADALARHPNLFPENEVRMIEASERAGEAPAAMLHIARFLDRLVSFWRKVTTGLIYPTLLVVVAFGFLPLFIAFFVGDVGQVLRQQLTGVGVGTAAVLIGVTWWRFFSSLSWPRVLVHRLLLGVPIFGKLSHRLALVRFADTFDCLYRAGVRVPEAMARAARACGNAVIGRRILEVVPLVAEGTSVSVALGQSRAVPALGLNLIEVGEQVGKLDEALEKFAEYQGNDAETTIERVGKILPMVVYFGVIVVMVIMIFRGVSSYAQTIQNQMR